MKRFFTFLLLVCPAVCLSFPLCGYAKLRMIVQLVAESYIGDSGLGKSIFVVLPDGSHATADCWLGMNSSCGIDPFSPEKRIAKPCHSAQEPIATCYTNESYYAARKVNDLTIYAANGGRVYHITGSWTAFEPSPVRGASAPSAQPSVNGDSVLSAQRIAAIKAEAASGDADSQYNPGVIYAHGQGVPQDHAQAAVWFRKAAEQGDADSQQLLGALLFQW